MTDTDALAAAFEGRDACRRGEHDWVVAGISGVVVGSGALRAIVWWRYRCSVCGASVATHLTPEEFNESFAAVVRGRDAHRCSPEVGNDR